ncbi:MAG: L-threonylcarbamoyladenylate synthase [Actinomycetaceae bacterium]|nr:L-threonylcarbamoyladenylate synthase [Actinomycetaceae bacterium]
MVRYVEIHPVDPQPRLVEKAVEVIREGGVIAYPTDSGYAIGCSLANQDGLGRMKMLRHLDDKHHFTLVCRDFAQLGQMVMVSNANFRLIKGLTPGPYTFILKGTKEVPRMTLNPKKQTVGVRIPDHTIALSLVESLGEAILSTTLILPGQSEPMSEGWVIRDEIGHMLDAVVEGPVGTTGPTTVLDLTEDYPRVARLGAGDVSFLDN